MYDAKYVKTQHLVEAAYGIIVHWAKNAEAGDVSLEQAMDTAKNTIRKINMRHVLPKNLLFEVTIIYTVSHFSSNPMAIQ